MSYKVDNAIIMAAGMSSRFAPISYEMPKALITVKGQVLIERQITQLKNAGIKEIIIVTGYKKEQFEYLKHKFNVTIIENHDYELRNNNGSIYVARDYICNSYICSADNYFTYNPFETSVDESYYSALFSHGATKEWCMQTDNEGFINQVTIGGSNSWYMMGHVFWSEEFSHKFLNILLQEYTLPSTQPKLWEHIFMEHLDVLKMKIRKYPDNAIYEFDSLDELRQFDSSYLENSHSATMKFICRKLQCPESSVYSIEPLKEKNSTIGILFRYNSDIYSYRYHTNTMERISR